MLDRGKWVGLHLFATQHIGIGEVNVGLKTASTQPTML